MVGGNDRDHTRELVVTKSYKVEVCDMYYHLHREQGNTVLNLHRIASVFL